MTEKPILNGGRWCEPAVQAAAAEKLPSSWKIESAKAYLRDLRDPAQRLGATPDFFICGAESPRRSKRQ